MADLRVEDFRISEETRRGNRPLLCGRYSAWTKPLGAWNAVRTCPLSQSRHADVLLAANAPEEANDVEA
jgi:hypothetical protein